MISLVPVSPANVAMFKMVRLRALQDTPTAFGSTYAKESARTDEQWAQRAADWSLALRATGYLALDDGHPCGIAGGYFSDDQHRPYLISMWVEPAYRRRGLGRQLVEAIIEWARSRGSSELVLEVTTNNESAVRFYEQLGFIRTGKIVPYPNDPALHEYEMVKSI
jgi:ribosomal protein S18 acetylase RimI-like enzyme